MELGDLFGFPIWEEKVHDLLHHGFQNIFSIFQTWLMRRQPDPVLEKATSGSGGSKAKSSKPTKGLGGLPMAAQPDSGPKKKKKNRGPRTGG